MSPIIQNPEIRGFAIGLEEDLGMQGLDLNIALTVFYVFVCRAP